MEVARPADAAASRSATATPPGQDDTRVRDLYNALRSGDQGVGCESFLGAFYFLQHRFFSLFDVREAFATSTSSSERFLSYRDFQYALLKTARAFAMNEPSGSDAVLLARLLDAVADLETHQERRRMDSIRRQLTKPSVIAVLIQHMNKLIQSFQMYGVGNVVQTKATWAARDTSTPMTLEGFVDFLNGYFEYEEYFSFQSIEETARGVVHAFGLEDEEVTLYFPQFIELLCRVASQFHVKTLEREGAQLRKAIESCRLEFSIELLMEKMNICMFKDEEDQKNSVEKDSLRPATAVVVPGYDTDVGGIEELSLDDGGAVDRAESPKEVHSVGSLLRDIKAILLGASRSETKQQPSKQQRPQSVLFSRLPPRKSSPPTDRTRLFPPWVDHRQEDAPKDERPWEPPQMTLIREVISPPPLPTNILKRLEHAITYQNTGQYHMALGALHKCQFLYKEWRRGNSDEEDVEARVYFSTMAASVYDSARNDHRALAMYVDALRGTDRLPLLHPGRALVKSCLGCFLFYIEELSLAKLCHEQVLDFRRHSPDGGDDHIDTATTMNNLACCLSQDPAGTAIEEAYLLLKTAKRIYSERLGVSHPRVETVTRNFDRVLASQRTIVVDPVGALARGEYSHVIPGSRFQIKALVPVKKEKAAGGKKKKKKGAKGGKAGKKKK